MALLAVNWIVSSFFLDDRWILSTFIRRFISKSCSTATNLSLAQPYIKKNCIFSSSFFYIRRNKLASLNSRIKYFHFISGSWNICQKRWYRIHWEKRIVPTNKQNIVTFLVTIVKITILLKINQIFVVLFTRYLRSRISLFLL